MSEVKKQSKGLPAIALRFIYFAVAVALFVVAVLVTSNKSYNPFELLGLKSSPTGTVDLVQSFVDLFGSGSTPNVSAIFSLIIVLGVTVYEMVLVIIAAVYVVILVINLILYASVNKDKEKLFTAFRKIERSVTTVIFMFFVFDCFLKVSGGVPAKGLLLEVIALIVIFVGNSCFKILTKDVFGEGKFDVQKLIYSVLEMLFVAGTVLAIYLTVTKEAFFGEFFSEFLYAVSGSMRQPGPEFFAFLSGAIIRLVGFFIALSMIKPIVTYYPFDDKKGSVGHCSTDSLLGKTIAALVLYLVSGAAFAYAGKFAGYGDVLKGAPLMLIGVLGVAITIRVAQKANKPVQEAKAEEKPAEAPVVEEKKEEPKAEEKPAEEAPKKEAKKE